MNMLQSTISRVLLIFVAAFLTAVADGETITDSAQARVMPWSGYWWPMRQGGLTRPLGKYDQLTGRRAVAWEQANRQSGPDVPQWFGFCHAWAAAAIMEREPSEVRLAGASGSPQLKLSVGDQKGIVTACHTQDQATSYGDRFGDGHGSEDAEDLAPDLLWKYLRLHIRQQGVPLVLDVESGPEVWNFPVYAYEVNYSSQGNTGEYLAQLSLLMADDGVPPDHVGCKVRRQTYQFTFRMHGTTVDLGSGRWVGSSIKDHPDFAWYPFLAVSENPEVIHAEVRRILTVSPSPAEPPQPEPSKPRPPQPAAPRPEPPQPEPAGAESRRPEALPISPLELLAIIAEKTSSFGLDVTVDRFDGARYQAGERFAVRVATEKPGYLYLLHIDSGGTLSVLYPQPGQNNAIHAGPSLTIPGARDPFVYQAMEPPGTNRVKAIVVSRPLVLAGLLSPAGQQQAAPATQGKPDDVRQTFRWQPTLRRHIQDLLREYQQRDALRSEQVDNIDPRKVLGAFAQDEVAFYVEPASRSDKPRRGAKSSEGKTQNDKSQAGAL